MNEEILPALDETDIPTVEGYTASWAERKLLKALFDPKNMEATVTAICKDANVARETYYQAIRKPGFVASIQAYAKDATKGKAGRYVHLLEKFAQEGSFQHLRVLLAMSGLYDEKMTIEVEPVRAVLRPRAQQE